jgi:DNA-binding MarR family transcriptional regulator
MSAVPTAPDSPAGRLYGELARLIERLHRRFLDVVRIELARIGIDDISPVQALMLMTIGGEEISVRDLIERGYYLGSNASYNLKNLVDAGYVLRTQSQRDRRSARLRLTPQGSALYQALKGLEQVHVDGLVRDEADFQDLEAAYRTLRRLERTWTDAIRYDGLDVE